MTNERYAAIMEFLTPWLREMQIAMGFTHWEIEIMVDLDDLPEDEQGAAGVWRWVGQLAGAIYISPWSLEKKTQEEVRATVLHEFVHFHTRPVWEIRQLLNQKLGDLLMMFLADRFNNAEEVIAEGISLAIAERFPLPPDWKHLLNGGTDAAIDAVSMSQIDGMPTGDVG